MIIDCHSHIWPDRECLGEAQRFSCLASEEQDQADPESHLAASAPADVTIILGFVCDALGAEISNDYLESYVRSQPGRIMAFAGVDPTRKECLDVVDMADGNDAFSGITISPACQGFHPCDSRAMRVYDLANQYRLPVYILQGEVLPAQSPLSFNQPSSLDEVAQAYPDLKIVISHLGFPWVEQTIALLAKHSNVYSDVAGLVNRPWQAYRSINLVYEYGVGEKLLFGSDYPRHTVKESVETLYNLNKITLDTVLPPVPREQLRGIVERDSLTLLGMEQPQDSKDE